MRSETELNEALCEWLGLHFFYGPNFCHSLDGCIKWLGPKLAFWSVAVVENGFRAYAETLASPPLGTAIESTPALAFARAVEKVMDAEAAKKEEK